MREEKKKKIERRKKKKKITQKERKIFIVVLLQYLRVTQEWSALLVISCFSRDWWAQNRPPLQTRIRLVSWGQPQ